MEDGFTELMYQDLNNEISYAVRGMNENKSLVEILRGVTYKVQSKSYDEFVNHREDIIVTGGSRRERKKGSGVPIVAMVYINEKRDGLGGDISSRERAEKIYDVIHSFSHKYNVSTGNLLQRC